MQLRGKTSKAIAGGQNAPMQVMNKAATSATLGLLHIRTDDSAEIHFNGRRLGSSTVHESKKTKTFRFNAKCDTGTDDKVLPPVLAVHGKDSGGAAAILASWKHCGRETVSDMGCRCTSKKPVGAWTSNTYDDSKWSYASDGGQNGADPWGGNPKIAAKARWIWAGDNFAINEAYCRCSEGHLQPKGMTTDGFGNFHIRVDDTSRLYVNGKQIGQTTIREWATTLTFDFRAQCDKPTVYAIDGRDKAGVAAVIGDVNHCGEAIQTLPNRWKCSTTCPAGWQSESFDDSKWASAVDAGINGVAPWGHTDVSPSAHWIWTAATSKGKDGKWKDNGDRACCRYKSDHRPINCNAARKRYSLDYPDVTISNQYAYSAYMQKGRREGRIW